MVCQLNLQLLIMSFGKEVKVVIAEPELSTQIPKPCLIVSPVSEEVNTAILPSLENLSRTYKQVAIINFSIV